MKYAILLVACLALPARAEFMDGNSLLTKINGDVQAQAVALGYIQGVFDTLRGVGHCANSPNITAGQLMDMVQQHLILNPSGRHFTADVIVGYVLKRSWPCPQKNQGGQGT